MLKHKMIPLMWLLGLALVLAACGSQSTPDPDGPLLKGFDALPKQLATIALSPTLERGQVEATQAALYTPTPAVPPTFTPTATPLVGVFMGNLTPLPGTLVFRPRSGPTGPAIVVTIVPGLPPIQATSPLIPGLTPGVVVTAPVVALGTPGTLSCAIQPAAPFTRFAADAAVQSRLGCPNADAQTVTLVVQPFQNGLMFWRDNREIYALAATPTGQPGQFWRFPDAWTEGQPVSDPALTPPENLLQPVRGFGLVWRSNAPVRERLGWATAPEQPYQAILQNFERGWMFTGIDAVLFAFSPSDANPTSTGSSGSYFGPIPQ